MIMAILPTAAPASAADLPSIAGQAGVAALGPRAGCQLKVLYPCVFF